MTHDTYQNPLVSRYASPEMSQLWSPRQRIMAWRQMWIWLAEAEQELGLGVTAEQVAELKAHQDEIDFARAAEHEKRRRHDVMAHVETYGELCPTAKGIIHLGATSCFVTDNADLILFRRGLELVQTRLAATISALAEFAQQHRDLPCLGYTHLQPAQPTTVGKRTCLWIYDLVLDLEELEHRLQTLRARSVKGTTGTQASFLKLFGGDHGKVRELEALVAEKMGFDGTYAVTGQTYPRKLDAQILDVLSGVAQSSHKIATDLRLLASWREIDEPYEEAQIGSSAMPYKRNPMRSERVCSLARLVMSLQSSPANTLATQWMERTLDDSANRRIVIPQAMLAIDAVLVLLQNIASGMRVYPQVIKRRLMAELPFMLTENIMMAAVEAGGDRQELHEAIRVHSLAATEAVKIEGRDNDVLDRLRNDSQFSQVDFSTTPDPLDYVGRSPEQVDEFISDVIEPIRARYGDKPPSAEVFV